MSRNERLVKVKVAGVMARVVVRGKRKGALAESHTRLSLPPNTSKLSSTRVNGLKYVLQRASMFCSSRMGYTGEISPEVSVAKLQCH